MPDSTHSLKYPQTPNTKAPRTSSEPPFFH
jgi:hypothetical protein